MNFESLANELIFDIFEYLTSIELIESFCLLNSRLNNLLFEYFHQCPLDFCSISKERFLSLCQTKLPLITNEISSMYISNEDETFDQLNIFYLSKLDFRQFTNLKSLTLESINSGELLNNILSHCPQLIYLNLVRCYFDVHMNSIQSCLNTIWSLQQLQSCYLNEFFIHLLNQISLSMIFLSIDNHPLSFDCLLSLFSFVPNIQYLTVQIRDSSIDEDYFSFPMLTLTNLTINFRGQWNTLKNFFEYLPNLVKLKLELFDCCVTGYQWEDLISNSLINLRTFHYFNVYQCDESIEYDELFESYRTSFWLDEHRWFIRCDCHSESRRIYLFTLPYCFRKFHHYDYDQTRTTANESMRRFSLVKDMIFKNYLSKFSFEFPRIEHLELAIPFHERFWSSLTNLDRLKSLEINSFVHSNEFERAIDNLHIVLEKASHLYSLTIDYLILSQLATVNRRTVKNCSIRRLDLMVNDGHFYGNECLNLIENFLENQCEVLLINIEQREMIVDIISRFTNLRTLIIQCQDDDYDETDDSIDELLIWLREHLSKTYSINRDENETSVIRIWIQ